MSISPLLIRKRALFAVGPPRDPRKCPPRGVAQVRGCSHAVHLFTLHLFTPHLFTPRVFTPRLFTPCLFTPHFFTPRLFTPHLFTTRLFTGTWRARRAHPLGRRVRRRRRSQEFGNGLSHIEKPSAPEAQEDGSWDLALNAPRAVPTYFRSTKPRATPGPLLLSNYCVRVPALSTP